MRNSAPSTRWGPPVANQSGAWSQSTSHDPYHDNLAGGATTTTAFTAGNLRSGESSSLEGMKENDTIGLVDDDEIPFANNDTYKTMPDATLVGPVGDGELPPGLPPTLAARNSASTKRKRGTEVAESHQELGNRREARKGNPAISHNFLLPTAAPKPATLMEPQQHAAQGYNHHPLVQHTPSQQYLHLATTSTPSQQYGCSYLQQQQQPIMYHPVPPPQRYADPMAHTRQQPVAASHHQLAAASAFHQRPPVAPGDSFGQGMHRMVPAWGATSAQNGIQQPHPFTTKESAVPPPPPPPPPPATQPSYIQPVMYTGHHAPAHLLQQWSQMVVPPPPQWSHESSSGFVPTRPTWTETTNGGAHGLSQHSRPAGSTLATPHSVPPAGLPVAKSAVHYSTVLNAKDYPDGSNNTNFRRHPIADGTNEGSLVPLSQTDEQEMAAATNATSELSKNEHRTLKRKKPPSANEMHPRSIAYNGELQPDVDTNSTGVTCFAETVLQQLTNALLAVETRAAMTRREGNQTCRRRFRRRIKRDRAGLELLILFHSLKKFPQTSEELHAMIQERRSSNPSLEAIAEFKDPVAKVADIAKHFFPLGGFCTRGGDQSSKLYEWNPQWVEQILFYDTIPHPDEAPQKVRRVAVAYLRAVSVTSLPNTTAALIEDLGQQLPQEFAAAMRETRGPADLIQQLVDTFFRREHFLFDDSDERGLRWNFPLLTEMFPPELREIPLAQSAELAATQIVKFGLLASSFPLHRMRLLRILESTTHPAVHGLCEYGGSSGELAILRIFIQKQCLEVSANGAFTWNQQQLLYSFPEEHAAQGSSSSVSSTAASQLAAVSNAREKCCMGAQEVGGVRLTEYHRSGEPESSHEEVASSTEGNGQRSNSLAASVVDRDVNRQSSVIYDPQVPAESGKNTCASSEEESGAATAEPNDTSHTILTNASNPVDDSVRLESKFTKSCDSSGSMLSNVPSTIADSAAYFTTNEAEPGEIQADEEHCLANTDTPSADPVALRRLKSQAQTQLKHAMLLKKKALKARLRQQQHAELPAQQPIDALLKGGLACLLFTDINNSGPQEKVRFLTRPLVEVAASDDDSYIPCATTTARRKPVDAMQRSDESIAAAVATGAAGSGEKQDQTREYLVQKRKDADRKRWVSTFNNFVSQQERRLPIEETKGKETEEQLRSCEAELESEERKLVDARGNSEFLLTRKEVLDTLLAEQVAELITKRTKLHDLENKTP